MSLYMKKKIVGKKVTHDVIKSWREKKIVINRDTLLDNSIIVRLIYQFGVSNVTSQADLE